MSWFSSFVSSPLFGGILPPALRRLIRPSRPNRVRPAHYAPINAVIKGLTGCMGGNCYLKFD